MDKTIQDKPNPRRGNIEENEHVTPAVTHLDKFERSFLNILKDTAQFHIGVDQSASNVDVNNVLQKITKA